MDVGSIKGVTPPIDILALASERKHWAAEWFRAKLGGDLFA